MTQAETTAQRLECDVIMKGGITSGIVYPGVVVELSSKYTFRQIGGASAGAIAATMAAAAETGRRNETSANAGAAIEKLGAIPNELGKDLVKLFQPSPSTAPAFDVLMAWLRPGASTLAKLAGVIGKVIRNAFGAFLFATIVAMIPALVFDVALLGAPASGRDWWVLIGALLVWLPVALIVGAVVAAVVVARRANTAITANGFGICNGHAARPGTNYPPLTDWMESKLRDLAGTGTHPVRFGDLWGEAAVDEYRKAFDGVDEGEAARIRPQRRRELREMRSTDCLVMTTDLNHHRPYRFPFDTQIFYWCETCLGDYFPPNVMREMKDSTEPVGRLQVGSKDAPREIDTKCPRHPQDPLYFMPLAPDIPLVIAARLSLSFPGLISAVPFQAVDWTRAEQHRGIVTVWFSDGGISSNFPMRFFDTAWPSRPTFGINLAPQHPDQPEMVRRPPPGTAGRLPRYVPIASLGDFAAAILDTMQNWADSTQITMPGFRDRIVEVRQRANEGGMNLQMPPDVIDGLARRGNDAGKNLAVGDAATPPFDFTLHRWMRYRNAMASLDDLLTAMHSIWPDQRVFLDSIPKDYGHFEPGASDREATEKAMQLADDLAALRHPATLGSVPRPQPEQRLTPPV